MTEFRSKGKGSGRKVYPLRKVPYGVDREIAFRDVEFLRAGGSRARLVNTNRKLHLYAPYVSALEINREARDEERTPLQQKPVRGDRPSVTDARIFTCSWTVRLKVMFSMTDPFQKISDRIVLMPAVEKL